jgi:radical SAM superfamily enzyme YgiQ (UPF0313 family)
MNHQLLLRSLIRFLFINPCFGRKIKGQTPLNLAYLAAAVEKFATVKIIDLNICSANELDQVLADFKPTHVGITSYTPNCIDGKEILKKIHERYPQVITFCGGPHEVHRGDVTKELFPWIDHVVTDRKAENTLVKILTGRDLHLDWRSIFPAYHLLDMTEPSYRFDEGIFPGKKMLQYMSARGCNMHCLFCPSEDYIPLENHMAINHLKKIVQMGYEALFFNDVNFASFPGRTRGLMQLMIKEGLHRQLEWGCQTAAVKELSDDLLQLMATAGCTYITFSMETASREGLEMIKKRIDPAVVAHKAQFAKNLGLKVGLYVMFGIHPDEQTDWQWAQTTLDMIGTIGPDYVSYSVLADYPSTNPSLDYEHVQYGTEGVWKFFDEGQAHHPHCSVEYAEKLKAEVLRRHALWPKMKTF